MAQSRNPSLNEGSALDLIIDIINLFDINEYCHKKEPKAFALKNSNYDRTSTTISTTDDIKVISASNIDEINVENLKEFSSKSMELIKELQNLKCSTWKFQIVPCDFYSRDIEYRAKNILSAPSIDYLCKSLLMKNTKFKCFNDGCNDECKNDLCNDRLNSKYYLVIFQYNQKLKQQKLQKFVKKLRNKSNKYFKFSLASLQETKELTNFEFNCVSPIGIGNIPIIVSHHILNANYKYIWIGSGSLNVKLRIDTQEFTQKYQHFVADITSS